MSKGFGTAVSHEIEEQLKMEAYKKFLESDLPSFIDNYSIEGSDLVIRLFYYDASAAEQSKFSLSENKKKSVRSFSIAKVLLSGPESIYKPGDVIKLRDYECMSLEAPEYRKYAQGAASRPMNSKVVSDEPDRWVSNLANFYQDKIFVMNPLAKDLSDDDFFTYKISEGYVTAKIKDPNALIGN